jgi:hypothetical protein
LSLERHGEQVGKKQNQEQGCCSGPPVPRSEPWSEPCYGRRIPTEIPKRSISADRKSRCSPHPEAPDRNVAFWQHGDADVAILRKLYFYKDLRFITRPIMFTENNIFSGQKKENGRNIYPKYLPEKNLELSELTQAGDWHRFCLKTQ